MVEFVVKFVLEIVVIIGVQGVGRSLLWALYAGRRPWSEVNEHAADAAGILFWALLIGGIIIALKVFG